MERFFDAPLAAHELMRELAQLKAEELIFTQVSLFESVVTSGKKSRKKGKAASKSIEYAIRIDGEVHERDLDIFDVFKGCHLAGV